MNRKPQRWAAVILPLLLLIIPRVSGQPPLSADQLLSLKSITYLHLRPDGSEIIYAVSTPRGPNEAPGTAHPVYYRMNVKTGVAQELFKGTVKGTMPRWSSDGKQIGFLYGANGNPRQVWVMPSAGGTPVRLTEADTNILTFRWRPGARAVAYLSQDGPTPREKELKERGYGFIFYEENVKKNNLYLEAFDEEWQSTGQTQLTSDVQVWDFIFDKQGSRIAASISPENLIDQRYMFRKVYLIDAGTGARHQVSANEGKLGNYSFSPDGTHLAYTASLNLNDHQVSQLYVTDLAGGEVQNLTEPGFRGHVEEVFWKDNRRLLYLSGEGVSPTLSEIPLKGGKRKIVLNASELGIAFRAPVFSEEMKGMACSGSTPSQPSNIYYWDGKGTLRQMTDINPVMKGVSLGTQEVIRYQARDGKEIEGILIHPVGYKQGTSYPLIVYVHGGPESHHSNGWLSSYSTPGQVMAGKSYLVLYLNYRSSTGYGVEFGMEGLMDPAGKEFDDIADAIDWVVLERGADPRRVGLAGGSYGGYASAWFATYYTRYVKAVCMFVGISDLISKRGSTDIPYEERYVHSGKPLEEQWQMNLERSPIYWAHQSRTATLIYGGAADTRVHPSQSLELYRRMKMNGHPAVRLVQYPGEGHGNRMQVGRIDVLYRQMEWFDWYVRDGKPLEGPMPRLDISDRYGLDWNLD